MSIANLLIGQKPEPRASIQQENETPISARDLIDAVAETEFRKEGRIEHDTTGVGSPDDGGNPETGNVTRGKGKKGDMARGKNTPGQVAKSPHGNDPVSYGKM